MEFSITLVLVLANLAVSIPAFNNSKLMNDLIFYPPAIANNNQYYRFITHGFLHADIAHLAFNMIALYSFGGAVEQIFSLECLFGSMGKVYYLLMYLVALVVATLPTYLKNVNNYHYRSLGASGAVSAVVFAGLTLLPQLPINFMFIPIDIPGYIFGISTSVFLPTLIEKAAAMLIILPTFGERLLVWYSPSLCALRWLS